MRKIEEIVSGKWSPEGYLEARSAEWPEDKEAALFAAVCGEDPKGWERWVEETMDRLPERRSRCSNEMMGKMVNGSETPEMLAVRTRVMARVTGWDPLSLSARSVMQWIMAWKENDEKIDSMGKFLADCRKEGKFMTDMIVNDLFKYVLFKKDMGFPIGKIAERYALHAGKGRGGEMLLALSQTFGTTRVWDEKEMEWTIDMLRGLSNGGADTAVRDEKGRTAIRLFLERGMMSSKDKTKVFIEMMNMKGAKKEDLLIVEKDPMEILKTYKLGEEAAARMEGLDLEGEMRENKKLKGRRKI